MYVYILFSVTSQLKTALPNGVLYYRIYKARETSRFYKIHGNCPGVSRLQYGEVAAFVFYFCFLCFQTIQLVHGSNGTVDFDAEWRKRHSFTQESALCGHNDEKIHLLICFPVKPQKSPLVILRVDKHMNAFGH